MPNAEKMPNAENKNRPLISVREGPISMSMFSNERNGRTWNSVNINKSFRDKQGKWQRTRFFFMEDLPYLRRAFEKFEEERRVYEQGS